MPSTTLPRIDMVRLVALLARLDVEHDDRCQIEGCTHHHDGPLGAARRGEPAIAA